MTGTLQSRRTAVLSALLVVVLMAASASSMRTTIFNTRMGFPGSQFGSSCDSHHTCGINARCTYSEGRPVCSCLNLHMGDPLVRCERVECLINEDCAGSKTCEDFRCVDPCAHACGTNANCQTRNHIPICQCPVGYTGDPFRLCVHDPEAACRPNPCGVNTHCEVINQVATCRCLPGYQGRPLEGCHHECEAHSDCPHHLHCSTNFRCESPCSQCGESAECDVVNHVPKCTCPKNWLGNPLLSCRPECTHHSDCPSGKPACIYQKCVNPCEGVCGIGANCELRDITPVCSCPKDMTGDPFISCRPFTDMDLCEPNPCGLNAECRPGHDNTGKKRPVCKCPNGWIGNALISCQRGECLTDSECPDNKACIDAICRNPCTGRECGINATCSPRRHIAVCTCNDGYRGDALYQCNAISGRTGKYGRQYRY